MNVSQTIYWVVAVGAALPSYAIESSKEHWAFRRPVLPAVPAVDSPDVESPIDAFLLERLRAEGLGYSPRASRNVLIRRLYLDVLGVPPSPFDVNRFLSDGRDGAYSRLVERVLASPRFGERLASWWLDLVRYADSNGYHADLTWSVSPYRDYVIRSFNHDLPFDRFTHEQIAGDLFEGATLSQRVAAGYHRLNMKSTEFGIQDAEYLAKYQSDRVRTTASTWLGVTLGCAECHDHKFDPFSAREFYEFAAFFADIKGRGYYPNAQGVGWGERIPVPSESDRVRLNELDAKLGRADSLPKAEVEASKKERKTILSRTRTMLATVSVKPREVRVLPRGNWMDRSGPLVQPGVPQVLGGAVPKAGATRRDLATWLTSEENPLTARVFVNRVWQRLFGVGLSKTLDDFGIMGEKPLHPELLDWLAIQFVESSWSVKDLFRRIVLSRAYRQSSTRTAALDERDPKNRLFARQSSFRLDAESIRDNALAISGLIDLRLGGSSVKPYQPAGYWDHLYFPRRTYKASAGGEQYRRAVYTHWQRQFLHPALKIFDAPPREECTVERPRSNTPLGALVMLNDPSQVEAARALAQSSLHGDEVSDGDRVQVLAQRALARYLSPAESKILLEFLSRRREDYAGDTEAAKKLVAVGQSPLPKGLSVVELAAWTSLARAILNLHETITRN
ncbi:MAG: DUF1549 and DUF1553 domain-containing protein [Planctomycetota bacterium]